MAGPGTLTVSRQRKRGYERALKDRGYGSYLSIQYLIKELHIRKYILYCKKKN